MNTTKRNARSLLERAESIFDLINKEEEAFPKSKLKQIGLNPKTAENWLKLILFIQDQPKIQLKKMSNITYVERIENKFQQMSMKAFLDRTLPIDVRIKSLEDYSKAHFVQERKSFDIRSKSHCKVCDEKKKDLNPLSGICQSCIKKYTEKIDLLVKNDK